MSFQTEMRTKKILKGIPSIALLALSLSCNKQQETKPQRKVIQQAIFASGFLEQEDEYVIAATADGTIQELNIREGNNISAGQMLVRIKSDVSLTQLHEAQVVYADARQNASASAPQLSQIQSQISLAKAQLTHDKINYERYADLRKKSSVSQLEFEKAELQYKISRSNVQVLEKNYRQVEGALRLNAARSLQQVKTQQAALSEYSMKADKAGIVLDVLKKKGELVRKGEVIAKIGSGRHILKLFIAEDDITKLSVGLEAVIQMNNYPDTTFTASITKILPAFDQSQQSYIAEAILSNPPRLLLSGTQLQANIKQQGAKKVLVIQSSAIIRSKYVLLKNGEEKEVRTGQKMGNWIEVKSGLTEDDIILLPNGKNKTEGITMPGSE
jgi:membrane fusion protein, macrolide-specific efflux system